VRTKSRPSATDGSSLHPVSASSDFGFRFARNVCPRAPRPRSPSRTGGRTDGPRPSTALSASTQWIVPFTLRPSGESPPRVAGVVGAAHRDHGPARVLLDPRAGHEVRVPEPHLSPGREPEEVLRRVLAEVVLLDVQHLRERHLSRPGRRILRVVDRVHVLGLPVRVVLDDDLQRPEHAHHPRGLLVQVFAEGVFEPRDVDHAVVLRDPDAFAELPHRLRGVSAAPHRRRSWACAGRPSR